MKKTYWTFSEAFGHLYRGAGVHDHRPLERQRDIYRALPAGETATSFGLPIMPQHPAPPVLQGDGDPGWLFTADPLTNGQVAESLHELLDLRFGVGRVATDA